MRLKWGSAQAHAPTYRTFLIGTLAIAGIPPLAGFYSKDEILYKAFSAESTLWEMGGVTLWAIGLTAALITAFYMFRAVFMTFYGKSRVDHHVAEHLHESPAVMTTPLWILAILSIIGGWVGIPWIESMNVFPQWLEPVMKGKAVVSQLAEEIRPLIVCHHSLNCEIIDGNWFSFIVASIGFFIALIILFLKNRTPRDEFVFAFSPVYRLAVGQNTGCTVCRLFVIAPCAFDIMCMVEF